MAYPGLDAGPIIKVVQVSPDGQPVYASGSVTTLSQTSQTLTGNNTTVNTPLFHITGSIEVVGLWAVVTTVLGSNVTAAFWRLNDQTAQPAISLATGTIISAAAQGSQLSRQDRATIALTASTNGAGKVFDPVASTAPGVLMPFIAVQKTGGVQTDIEFSYTTTNTPTSGVLQHFIRWRPLSADGNLTVV